MWMMDEALSAVQHVPEGVEEPVGVPTVAQRSLCVLAQAHLSPPLAMAGLAQVETTPRRSSGARYLDGLRLPRRSDWFICTLIRECNPANEYTQADVERDAADTLADLRLVQLRAGTTSEI
mgnify:CR=1 FL=1